MNWSAVVFAQALSGTPGVHFVDVGQGACVVVVDALGTTVVVDSGPSAAAERVLWALRQRGVAIVDLWIHTHFDADHVSGGPRVVAGEDGVHRTGDDVGVMEAWDRGLVDRPHTDGVDDYLMHFGAVRRTATPGQSWHEGQIRVVVLESAAMEAARSENERGLVLCVELGGTTLLLPGDRPAATLHGLAGDCPDVDVLVASHHGADDGTDAVLLAEVEPRLVVISAGYRNAYCHPGARTLALLWDRPVWITGAAGLGDSGPCPALGTRWRPGHRVAGTDLWLALE